MLSPLATSPPLLSFQKRKHSNLNYHLWRDSPTRLLPNTSPSESKFLVKRLDREAALNWNLHFLIQKVVVTLTLSNYISVFVA